jgi:glycosyltransferase involved in cell wall biosynthesis
MWRLIAREQPDILHIHSRRGADSWGSLIARLTGQPAILTRRVDNPEPTWQIPWKYGPFRRIIAISEGIRRILLAEGVPAEKVSCVHSALESGAYAYAADPDWFLREFDLPAGAVAIGVVAQLIERKGHRYLIEAAPAIVENCPSVHFLFFGKGPERERLAELCRHSGVAERFIFAGFREDLPRILPNLALLVHPALMEGLGIALLQASASGVPIVAARAGGIPEVVHHGVNGLLVEPGASAPLQAAILELLASTRTRERMSVEGPRLVAESFSAEAMVEGNLRQYQQLLASTRSR